VPGQEEAIMGDPFRVRVTGPLVPYVAGFREELTERGYSSSAATAQLHLMAHLSRWLCGRGLGTADLTAGLVEEFVGERRSAGYANLVSSRALKALLGHLRGLGVMPVAAPSANPMELLLEDYRRALMDGRGLAASTAGRYVNVARMFLVEVGGGDGFDLGGLSAGDVSGFVVRQGRRLSVGSTKDVVNSLRSFLRFLDSQGLIEGRLVSAVPAVASWRGASLPRALSAEQVSMLLETCDPDSAVGRRDLAMLTLLARLGLRAREVASLELGDVDWRHGEIVVRGKGGRCERLPVPVDVGDAVVGYLCHGRPPVTCRAMFLRVCAPICGLGPKGVSGAVRSACVRAGLPAVGAHRLRHSAATAMLQAGSSLSDVGQVLRHNQLATTAIYAKVDRGALEGLAQQWPGGAA